MKGDRFFPWATSTPGAHAINRAAVVLRILAMSGGEGISVSDVAQLTHMPKSTVHRLLTALVDERLAERARTTRRYRLGMEIVALAAAAGPKHDLRSIARPILRDFTDRMGYASHLMIRSGYDAVCLDQIIPPGGASMIGARGSRAPLGVGANSLALLAYLSDDEISDALANNRRRLTGHPVFGEERIREGIRYVRRHGYSVASIERNPPVFGVGVAILASNRRPLGAMGITTIDGRPLAQAEIERIACKLREDAARIGRDYEAIHESGEEGWLQAGLPG